MIAVSTDYHDYVFKDGALVGDFEGMYRNSARSTLPVSINSDRGMLLTRWAARELLLKVDGAVKSPNWSNYSPLTY